MSGRARLGVAVIGFGWMGQVHARAYRRVLHHFPDLPVEPVLIAAVDPEQERAGAAADQYGFERATGSWPEVLADPRVAAVSVTAPNYLHREIGAAVADAGKHPWIEKPVGLTAADALHVGAAVERAGVQSAVGFNYRNAPAVVAARELIKRGDLGAVTHARFRLFSDYAAHPQGALTWRFTRERGGDGVLGDLASHGIDLARFLLGEVDSLVADAATFISQRPVPTGVDSHFALATGGEPGVVENDDYVSCLLRFAGGARATLEACRVSVGAQCDYGFEIHGTAGAVFWDFRRLGELSVCRGEAYQNAAASTVYVAPGHGEYGAFQPGGGIAMGYDDLKVIEAALFLRSIAEGKPHGATISDAVRSALALDAMTESVRTGGWVEVPQ